MKNRWIKRYGLICLLLICSLISGSIGRIFAEAAPGKEVTSSEICTNTVLVGGMPVGIYLETDGVLVLSTQEVKNQDGLFSEPARNIVKSGDYIMQMNQTEITDKESLVEAVEALESEEVVLKLRRNDEIIQEKIEAVKINEKEYKLGIWVRDNIQGLGTITYLDSNHTFGALGHGIHDMDIRTLVEIDGGSLYKTNIRSVKKGTDGNPGSIEGIIVYSQKNKIGTVTNNTEVGIYGTLENINEVFEEQIPMETATIDEIEVGPAKIRCSVDGEIQEYEIEILAIDKRPVEVNKGLLLQVTDEELLEKTGGIIQGMGLRYNRDNTGNP